MYKTYLFLIFLTVSLNALTRTTLCFTSTPNNSFCPKEQNSTTVLNDINNTKNSIFTIQSAIREKINNKKYVLLMAENFDATLLAIAQSNLLPYYRKNIKGLVLKEPLQFVAENNETEEFEVALSIPKQMDWYWSKSIVMESNKTRKKIFREAFEGNGIDYRFVSADAPLKLDRWFPIELKCKVEPKKKPIKKPNYYGAILRLHLGKILYKPKSELVHKSSEQKYDIFYKKNSKDNPLFIYIHSGEWFDLCKQYADRGYTAVSINYRFLDLSKVGMNERIGDIVEAIKNIIDGRKSYVGDRDKIVLIADSEGALLVYMALTKLSRKYQPRRVIFNSLPTDLTLYSKEKQIMLSGIKDDNNRTEWIKKFSPLSPTNLNIYTPSTLVIQSLDDTIIVPKHLEELEIQSVIHNNNIHSLWIKNALHTIAPKIDSLQPSYSDIETKIDSFIQ